MVTCGGMVLVLQDSMSAAFGAGDFTSSAVAKASAASVRVGEVLGNTISLEEIMNATKTNVRRDCLVLSNSNIVTGGCEFPRWQRQKIGTDFELPEASADRRNALPRTKPKTNVFLF